MINVREKDLNEFIIVVDVSSACFGWIIIVFGELILVMVFIENRLRFLSFFCKRLFYFYIKFCKI